MIFKLPFPMNWPVFNLAEQAFRRKGCTVSWITKEVMKKVVQWSEASV